MQKGYLQLENGSIYEGELFGYINSDIVGEVIFNTSMTGYQEIFTDPSYYGQIVTMTYPLIGNYGINFDYEQSDGIKVRGVIVKEVSEHPNNFGNEMILSDYLANSKVTGLKGIDTRKLTRELRNNGVMKGIITTHMWPKTKLNESLKSYDNSDSIRKVSTKEAYNINHANATKKMVAIDYGIKENTIKLFNNRAIDLEVVPYDITSKDILDMKPDALFLSNGPGDPKDIPECIDVVKKIVGKLPILGICLGHQIVSLAIGGDTKKLQFGHRGSNHPVKNLLTNKVFMTSQNHGYVVDKLPAEVLISHVSLNDNTIEGMRDIEKKIYTVQFHPEICPRAEYGIHIFDEFVQVLG